MTSAIGGMPGSGAGPSQPPPAGRDHWQREEREARRLTARLTAAQRRLGQTIDSGGASLPSLEDIQVAPVPDRTARIAHLLVRLPRLHRRPTRD